MNVTPSVLRGLAAAIFLPLCACAEDYLNRVDTVSLSAGDAKEINRTTHMIDPWPRHASNRKLVFDGTRMQGAIERYETGETRQTEAAPTTTITQK